MNEQDDMPMLIPIAQEECPECGGSGEITSFYDNGEDEEDEEIDICPDCDGTGMVDIV